MPKIATIDLSPQDLQLMVLDISGKALEKLNESLWSCLFGLSIPKCDVINLKKKPRKFGITLANSKEKVGTLI